MLYKPISELLILGVLLIVSSWVFNHVNAWLGILCYIGLIYIVINRVTNYVNKLKK